MVSVYGAQRPHNGLMPELPEVEALAGFLREHAVGAVIGRIDIAALSVLKTFDPPLTELQGRDVTGAARFGKHLALQAGELWLVTHLSRAGWLRWVDAPSPTPPKPGKGPLALRIHFFTPEGLTPAVDLTEAGTKKRLAVWVVRDPQQVPSIAKLGPDALAVTEPEFAEILGGTSARLKTSLVDHRQCILGRDSACGEVVAVRGVEQTRCRYRRGPLPGDARCTRGRRLPFRGARRRAPERGEAFGDARARQDGAALPGVR